jgi:hypothetical protein
VVPPLASALAAAYAEGRSAHDEVLIWSGHGGVVCGEAAGTMPAAWVESEAEVEAVLAALGNPPVRRGDGFAPFARTLGKRRALPRRSAPALERHLGAAAGTALGMLASELWPESDPTPLLALERLGDLEARVTLTPESLVASIPRGRRWLDLRRAGLLEYSPVSWLPGGRLEIGTW